MACHEEKNRRGLFGGDCFGGVAMTGKIRVPIFTVPYLRLIRRLFVGPGGISSIAAQQNIIWPEETVRARSAICLPGQIERIVDRAPQFPFTK